MSQSNIVFEWQLLDLVNKSVIFTYTPENSPPKLIRDDVDRYLTIEVIAHTLH